MKVGDLVKYNQQPGFVFGPDEYGVGLILEEEAWDDEEETDEDTDDEIQLESDSSSDEDDIEGCYESDDDYGCKRPGEDLHENNIKRRRL